MIYYNFPYRGAFEYDKFVLNYLQYHNHFNHMFKEVLREDVGSVKELQREVDLLFKESVGQDKTRELVYALELIQ